MSRDKRKKVRKPKNFVLKLRLDGLPYTCEMDADEMPLKESRKLAAWLLKAALYREQQEST